MKGITIEQYGGPEVLQKRDDIPVPRPGPGELLVRVAYAGINFMDIHTRQGKYARSRTYPVRLPCTLGMEGAGEVVQIGEGVVRFSVGHRVAWCIAWGAYAEYVCIPAEKAALLPDDIGYAVAAASMFQGCTAHYLVNDVANLHVGDNCLVHAASGSIGQILIQMAKRLGSTVHATTSTADKADVAFACGADYVYLYDAGAFADAVRVQTGGAGVDVVFDSVGRATLRDSFRATRIRGMVVNYGSVSGSLQDLDPIELGEAGSLVLTRPRLADHMQDAMTVQRRADDVFAAILKGDLNIKIAGTYTLDDVDEVHARIENRTQIGKSILQICP